MWQSLQSYIQGLPGVEFSKPAWLLLAPLGWVLSLWIARGAIGGWGGRRQAVLLGVRCLVLLLIAVAMAEPLVTRKSRNVAVIVVRDVSRSVPGPQQKLAEDFVAASAAQKKKTDLMGQVTAARQPVVQTAPSAGEAHPYVGYVGDIDATNLQSGVELAKALLPSNSGGRIVLVSDGNQTSGNLLTAARAAAAAHVPVDVAPVEYDRSGGVAVRDLLAPTWARENETIQAKVVVESGRAATGRLSVMIDGEQVDLDSGSVGLSQSVEVVKGSNLFTVPLRLPPGGSHEIDAVIELPRVDQRGPSGVDVPELLRAKAVVFTSSRGRVLVVTEDAEAIQPLVNAISAQELAVEVRSASMAPGTLTELAGFDAVVLSNEPASNFSQAFQEDLTRYVHDAGGGLLMLGGPDSFGAGGWIGSPVADALPIVLDPPQKRQLPMGALAIIIDQSGSMASKVSGTTMDQQQVANEAAVLGVRALSRLDEVTVIAFSDSSRVVVPLTRCSDMESIASSIKSIGPTGGTNMFPAFRLAAAQLSRSEARVRHIVVLTDGETVGDPAEGLAIAARLKREGITMSTVAIGDSINSDLLKRLALVGGGRPYTVTSQNSMAVLPQIFIKESQTLRRALIWEGPAFRPSVGAPAESLRGIETPYPVVSGYVVAADRPGLASVLLRGPENDPILAQWQHGLGRVTTYASDATSRWNPAWTAWPGFGAFWNQQIRWTMRPQSDPNARLSTRVDGDRARVVVELFDGEGGPLNFARVRGRLAHPEGKAEDLVLQQTGPGRYEADAAIAGPGAHLASLRYDATENGQLKSGSLRAALVKRAGDEMRRSTPDTDLLVQVARETDGRVYQLDRAGADLWTRERLRMPRSRDPVWLLLALSAVGLFLVDVAARRLTLDVRRAYAWGVGIVVPVASKPSATMSTLSRAKAAATKEMKRVSDERVIATLRPNVIAAPPPPRDPEAVMPEPEATDPADPMARLRAAKKRGKMD